MTRRRFAAVALAAGAACLVSARAEAAPASIRGEAFYRERMALPPGSQLEVRLLDVTAPGRQSVVKRTTAPAGAGGPIAFTLRYDTRNLGRRKRYALQARISDARGAVLFSSEPQPWKPSDRGPARVLLQRAGGTRAAMGDAEPWGRWRARDVLGRAAPEKGAPTLRLEQDGRVSGAGGCNSFTGAARIRGRRIRFGRMASTMMACSPAMMEQERRFHEALGRARSFRVEAGQRRLLLLDANNRVVMRLSQLS